MTQKPQHNVMSINGKIVKVVPVGTAQEPRYSHQIVLKSEDEFSQPSGIMVSSSKMMGTEGDIINSNVKFSGYIKPVKYVDKETGEKKEFAQFNAYFNEVIAN